MFNHIARSMLPLCVFPSVTWRCFLCSCEGFRSRKHSIQDTRKYQRSETRTGCDAQIQVKLETGEWVITKLHLEHNHMLNCLETVNGLLHEEEGPFGANKVCQSSIETGKFFFLSTLILLGN